MANVKLFMGTPIIRKFFSSASERYLSAFISVVATLLLTYIYGIELIGFVGSFSVFVALGHVLSEGGIGQIILRHEMTRSVLSALFLINLALSIVIYCIFTAFSNVFSEWANISNFGTIFSFYCLIIVFNAIGMVPIAIITRAGNYMTLNLVNLFAMVISLTIVISVFTRDQYIWASSYFVLFYGIRSLLLLNCSRNMIFTRPGFYESGIYLKFGAFVFSAKILKANSENYLAFILPGLVGLEVAGLYGLLIKARELITGALSHAVHRVLYVERSEGNYSVYYVRRSALALTIFSSFVWLGIAIFFDKFLLFFDVKLSIDTALVKNVFLFVCVTTLCLPAFNIFTQMIQHSNVRLYSAIENSYALLFLITAFSLQQKDINSVFFGLSAVAVAFFVLAIYLFEDGFRTKIRSLMIFFLLNCSSLFLIGWALMRQCLGQCA